LRECERQEQQCKNAHDENDNPVIGLLEQFPIHQRWHGSTLVGLLGKARPLGELPNQRGDEEAPERHQRNGNQVGDVEANKRAFHRPGSSYVAPIGGMRSAAQEPRIGSDGFQFVGDRSRRRARLQYAQAFLFDIVP